MKVIGICGPHTSGKTALAYALAKHLKCDYLSLDEFFIKGKDNVYVNYKDEVVRTFERPELYDGERLARVINEIDTADTATFNIIGFHSNEEEQVTMHGKDFLVVEGFLLYQYPELRALIDHKFYVELSENEILRRRAHAHNHSDARDIFLKHGLDEYRQYGEPQKNMEDVYVLDGTKSLEEMKQHVLGAIRAK